MNTSDSDDIQSPITIAINENHNCGLERHQRWQQSLKYPDFPIVLDVCYTDYKKMRDMIEYPQKGEVARDVLRTFPQHSFFHVESIGSKMLSNILHIFVLCRPEIGYCQGMNFVTAIFMLGRIPSEYSGGLMLNKTHHSFITTINSNGNSNSIINSNIPSPSSSSLSSSSSVIVEAIPITPPRKVNVNSSNSAASNIGSTSNSDKMLSTKTNSDKSTYAPTTPIFLDNATDSEDVISIEYEVLQSMLLLADKHSKLSMCTLWHARQSQVKLRAYQFDQLCKWIVPKLHLHFCEIHLAPEVLVAQWFVTLFSYTVPLRITMKLWDYIFEHGWSGMFQIALSLLKCFETAMLKLDLEGVSGLLKRWRLRSQEYHDNDEEKDNSDNKGERDSYHRSISCSPSIGRNSSVNHSKNPNANRVINTSSDSYSISNNKNNKTNFKILIRSSSDGNYDNKDDSNNNNDDIVVIDDDHNITYEEIMSHVTVMPINQQVLQKLQESFALEMISMSEITVNKSEPATPTSNSSSGCVRDSKNSVNSSYNGESNDNETNVNNNSNSNNSSNGRSQTPVTFTHHRSKTTSTAAAALSSLFSNKKNKNINNSNSIGKSFSSNSVSSNSNTGAANTLSINGSSSGDGSTNWLDRYCEVISIDVAKDMLRIRDDLNILELQIDADKEHIQAKIIAACDTHRETQQILEQAQVRHSHCLTALVSLTEELDGVLSRGQEIAAVVYCDLEEYNMHTGGGSDKRQQQLQDQDKEIVTQNSGLDVITTVICGPSESSSITSSHCENNSNSNNIASSNDTVVIQSNDNNITSSSSKRSMSDSQKQRSSSNYDDLSMQAAAVVATLSHSIKSVHEVTSRCSEDIIIIHFTGSHDSNNNNDKSSSSSGNCNNDETAAYTVTNNSSSSRSNSQSSPHNPINSNMINAVLTGHSSFWSSRKKSSSNSNTNTPTSSSSSSSSSSSYFSRKKSSSTLTASTEIIVTATTDSTTATHSTILQDDDHQVIDFSSSTTANDVDVVESYNEGNIVNRNSDNSSDDYSNSSDNGINRDNNSSSSDDSSSGSIYSTDCEIELVPIEKSISTLNTTATTNTEIAINKDTIIMPNEIIADNTLSLIIPTQSSLSSSSSTSSTVLLLSPSVVSKLVPITSLTLTASQKTKRMKLLKQRMTSLSAESRQVQQQVITLQRELDQAKVQLTVAKDQLTSAYSAEEEAVERKRLLCEQFQLLVEEATRGRSQKLQYITDMYL